MIRHDFNNLYGNDIQLSRLDSKISKVCYIYNFDWLSETVDESAEADCVGKYIFERS